MKSQRLLINSKLANYKICHNLEHQSERVILLYQEEAKQIELPQKAEE